jgi:hypothetical protein
MQSLEGIAVTHPKSYPFCHVLFDPCQVNVSQAKTAAEVVQCCKNCLLVIFTVYSLQSLYGVDVGLARRVRMDKASLPRVTWKAGLPKPEKGSRG